MEFFTTSISEMAIQRANAVLESTFLSEGKVVQEFESSLSEQLGLINPVAVNSGTSALHLALVLAGVKAGDEVILPAQTFVATGLAILMQGAKPVFADVQNTTGNINPESIRQKISDRTKAVMVVHWGGYPCDMSEIGAIAGDAGVAVIEDAAHALGARYQDKPVGTLSRFTAFSFQAIKHLTTGDGGALCCLNENDYRHARNLRWFGIDRLNSKASILGEREYDLTEVGFKYHMNDLSAALGLGNLSDFGLRLARRQQIASLYRQHLADVSGVQLLNVEDDRTHAYWLFTLLVERREDFIRKLAESGIPASVVHLRIDHNSVFGGLRHELIGQAEFDARQVSVPVHERLSDEEVMCIITEIQSGW